MLAFHGNHGLKADVIMRTKIARETGSLWRQGGTIYNGVAVCGCAVGIQMQSDVWDDFETKLNLPLLLADLEAVFFRCWLEDEEAFAFPERLMEAIPVGADCSDLAWQLAKATLRDLGVDWDLEIADRVELREAAYRWGEEAWARGTWESKVCWRLLKTALDPDISELYARNRYVDAICAATIGIEAGKIEMAERLFKVMAAMPVRETAKRPKPRLLAA